MKDSKRNARVKNITKIKNVFDKLISRVAMAKERITELWDTPTQTSQSDKQREKMNETAKQNIQKSMEQIITVKYAYNEDARKRLKKGM
jgi:formiminotetrahydrofolate cyclodeaminase